MQFYFKLLIKLLSTLAGKAGFIVFMGIAGYAIGLIIAFLCLDDPYLMILSSCGGGISCGGITALFYSLTNWRK